MTSRRLATWLLPALLAAGCMSGAPPEAGTVEEALDSDALRFGPQPIVTVMSRNLYLGADINRLLGVASPAEIPATVAAVWETVQATDFPERARAIAWEIAITRPDVVSLQEVGLWRTGPGDSCVGGTAPAADVAYDFLAILASELERRGARYAIASTVENFDGELCGFVDGSFTDVRYTDRDALLVRGDRPFANPASGNFGAAVTILIGGAIPITIPRGWVAADVGIGARSVLAVGAHLEVGAGLFGFVQQLQAQELIGLFGGEDGPVLLSGDFNSAADGSTTTTYGDLLAAGYADPWTALRPSADGFTCCFDETLRTGALTSRIDLTLARNGPRPWFTFRVGSQPWERTRSGLWPSDHAGLVTVFQLR